MTDELPNKCSTERLYRNCLLGYGKRAIQDPQPFLQWLQRLPPNTTFGRGICDCPLARFSGHQVGYITYGDGYLPAWAVKFVAAYIPRKSHPPLTLYRAIGIMEDLL